MAEKRDSGSRRIPLTNGGSVLVSAEDYAKLSKHNWHGMKVGKTIYAVRDEGTGTDKKTIYMHREVEHGGAVVDHKDRSGLNNTRANLRPASQSVNQTGVKHDRKRANKKPGG